MAQYYHWPDHFDRFCCSDFVGASFFREEGKEMRVLTECNCEGESTRLNLASKDVTILYCIDSGEWTYSYLCPLHKVRVVLPLNIKHVPRLMLFGVGVKEWRLPTPEKVNGAKLTEDDLIDLAKDLERL